MMVEKSAEKSVGNWWERCAPWPRWSLQSTSARQMLHWAGVHCCSSSRIFGDGETSSSSPAVSDAGVWWVAAGGESGGARPGGLGGRVPRSTPASGRGGDACRGRGGEPPGSRRSILHGPLCSEPAGGRQLATGASAGLGGHAWLSPGGPWHGAVI